MPDKGGSISALAENKTFYTIDIQLKNRYTNLQLDQEVEISREIPVFPKNHQLCIFIEKLKVTEVKLLKFKPYVLFWESSRQMCLRKQFHRLNFFVNISVLCRYTLDVCLLKLNQVWPVLDSISAQKYNPCCETLILRNKLLF